MHNSFSNYGNQSADNFMKIKFQKFNESFSSVNVNFHFKINYFYFAGYIFLPIIILIDVVNFNNYRMQLHEKN